MMRACAGRDQETTNNFIEEMELTVEHNWGTAGVCEPRLARLSCRKARRYADSSGTTVFLKRT
eukprot:5417361-Pyramimonas_sp.AAC.1